MLPGPLRGIERGVLWRGGGGRWFWPPRHLPREVTQKDTVPLILFVTPIVLFTLSLLSVEPRIDKA